MAKAAKFDHVEERSSTVISLRMAVKVRNLIDAAAATLSQTRTEFMLDSAKQQAIDVLLDQRLFELEDDQWRAFNQALDNPPLPNNQLKKLMARTPPWEA